MADVVATALRSRGYLVEVAESGARALELVSVHEPDVVVLDLGLPDVDGAEVCVQLRRWFRNPIVVLSADGDELRKVAALEGGADDYITKPFSMPELLARMQVALRHRDVLAGAVDAVVVEVGDLRLDPAAHEVTVGGTPVALARKEFRLLELLARNAGRLLPHELLLAKVWSTQDLAKTETLRTHVNQLRRKLGDGPERPQIQSEPGVGYRLVRRGR